MYNYEDNSLQVMLSYSSNLLIGEMMKKIKLYKCLILLHHKMLYALFSEEVYDSLTCYSGLVCV